MWKNDTVAICAGNDVSTDAEGQGILGHLSWKSDIPEQPESTRAKQSFSINS